MSKPQVRRSDRDRLMAKVRVQPSGCWEWQGYIQANGYGYFRHPETSWAHRASWIVHRGPIPTDLQIDHLCKNKRCVNPDHLDPVTPSVNLRRARPWTKCPEFHPSEPSRFAARADGRQFCRECNRVREQRRRDSAALTAAQILDPHTTNAGNEKTPYPAG